MPGGESGVEMSTVTLSILIDFLGTVFICASDYEGNHTYLIPRRLWRAPAPEAGMHRIVTARHLVGRIYWVTGDAA